MTRRLGFTLTELELRRTPLPAKNSPLSGFLYQLYGNPFKNTSTDRRRRRVRYQSSHEIDIFGLLIFFSTPDVPIVVDGNTSKMILRRHFAKLLLAAEKVGLLAQIEGIEEVLKTQRLEELIS